MRPPNPGGNKKTPILRIDVWNNPERREDDIPENIGDQTSDDCLLDIESDELVESSSNDSSSEPVDSDESTFESELESDGPALDNSNGLSNSGINSGGESSGPDESSSGDQADDERTTDPSTYDFGSESTSDEEITLSSLKKESQSPRKSVVPGPLRDNETKILPPKVKYEQRSNDDIRVISVEYDKKPITLKVKSYKNEDIEVQPCSSSTNAYKRKSFKKELESDGPSCSSSNVSQKRSLIKRKMGYSIDDFNISSIKCIKKEGSGSEPDPKAFRKNEPATLTNDSQTLKSLKRKIEYNPKADNLHTAKQKIPSVEVLQEPDVIENPPTISVTEESSEVEIQTPMSDSPVNLATTADEDQELSDQGKLEPKTLRHDEYDDYDTSDEEDIRNTIGNIPANWYEDFCHIGYDWAGDKIVKPDIGDQIDYFLKKIEDPNFWRTVKDTQTGQDVILSDKDIETIKRLGSNQLPDSDFIAYQPWVEWFSNEVMHLPLRKFPEHKRSFLPSKDEMKKVSKYVHALKMGWMKTRKQLKKMKKAAKEEGPKFYDLWGKGGMPDEMRRIQNHIPAPKRPLPDHSESYNPPEEYLFTEKEMKKWQKDRKSLGDKKLHYIPQKYKSLREVPAYKRYVRERFLRCLDLYMCPRAMKMRLTIEPEDLVPELPSPKDLQPFPTTKAISFSGHSDMVRSISIDKSGQFLASVSDDSHLKIWEVSTSRCVKSMKFDGVGRSVDWCPNQSITLIAAAFDKKVYLINPGVGDHLIAARTHKLLRDPPDEDKLTHERVKAVITWLTPTLEQWQSGICIVLQHFKDVKQIKWHPGGDYFAAVMPEGENRSVLIHQLSRRRSQLPFSKPRGLVQAVIFHPVKPLFFVATQRNIRMYDLVKQEMQKKLFSNSKWISSMAIHPGGDNLLVGTYDKKVLWFDLDLSPRPYKSLALHNAAIRSVAYHKRYPLFASTSDDKSLIISHGRVYHDLNQNALIVPLKRLSYHKEVDDFSVFDVVFHPTQPWVFTSGADGDIILYT